jgi:hypothetical protein
MIRLPRKFICPKRNQQGIVMVIVAIAALQARRRPMPPGV